ncbi:MAG: hypothetical protein AB1634_01205 [Thermodesulfobacteriota bacterium]
MRRWQKLVLQASRGRWLRLLALALFLVPWPAQASDLAGWEKDSPYQRLYKPAEVDKIKVTVVRRQEVVPIPGMAPGLALVVTEGGEATFLVHLGPKSYLDRQPLAVAPGDTVKIRGVWAEIGGQEVFMAAKIKKDDGYQYKLRLTSDGRPFWSLSPEERAREAAAAD